jgi:hypothetical protein
MLFRFGRVFLSKRAKAFETGEVFEIGTPGNGIKRTNRACCA